MATRRLQVKGPFRLLHGESAHPLEIVVVYGGALLVAAALAIFDRHYFLSRLPREQVLLTLIALDLSAGVVALSAPSTAEYYAGRPRLSRVFLALHVVQPALVLLTGPEWLEPVVFVTIYTLASSAVVMVLRRAPKVARGPARLVAWPLVMVGGVIVVAGYHLPGYLAALFFIFMIKLIFCFGALPAARTAEAA